MKYPKHTISDCESPLFQQKCQESVVNFSRIIKSNELTDAQACKAIHLCAELIRFGNKNERNLWGKKYCVHDTMPDLFIKFCEGSCVHGGLRLMKRSCRHCVSKNEPDIREAIVSLGLYDKEDVYLHIMKRVAGSYHTKCNKKFYWTEAICTSRDLLWTKCQCAS